MQDATGGMLRARLDKFEDHGTHAIIWDVKTGKQPANPFGLGKRIANMGYEIQSAFYERVIIQLRPELSGRLTFRWAFIENAPPHFIQVSELDNTGLEIGRRKVAAAIGLWNRALQTGEWPAYPAKIVTAEYPVYAERQWMEREEFDASLHSLPPDPILCRPVPHTPKPMLDVIAS